MTARWNRAGPTRIWKTLKGKAVKTSDGKDLGEIKKISEDYLLLQKGTLRKEEFWIPKYASDVFDGKILWLLLSEEEIREKHHYGKPPISEKYAREFESFKAGPYGQEANYGTDFHKSVRVVENYKNIRDLHTRDEGSGLTPRPAGQIHGHRIEKPKENERKEKDEILKSVLRSVREIKQTEKKQTAELRPAETKVLKTDSASPAPIRPISSQVRVKTLVKATERHARNPHGSPVRITSEDTPAQRVTDTPPAVNKSHVRHGSSSTAVATSIEPGKEIDKKPVLAPIWALEVAKATQEKIMPVSEINLLATLPPNSETVSSNLISKNDSKDYQTETTENVSSMSNYQFNPFLIGMDMWQVWLEMSNQCAIISVRLSQEWFDSLWRLLKI